MCSDWDRSEKSTTLRLDPMNVFFFFFGIAKTWSTETSLMDWKLLQHFPTKKPRRTRLLTRTVYELLWHYAVIDNFITHPSQPITLPFSFTRKFPTYILRWRTTANAPRVEYSDRNQLFLCTSFIWPSHSCCFAANVDCIASAWKLHNSPSSALKRQ